MALGKGLGSLIPQDNKKEKNTKSVVKKPSDDGQKIWHIPLSEIVPNTEQPRKDFSHTAMEDLVASIKQYGILQPVTVTERNDGGYELIAGERRFRASQIAGLATVPALVRSATEQEKLELALIENIQRQDLNPIEEAFSFKRLMDEFGVKQDEIAKRVGKSRPQISNTVRLLELPDEIQQALMDGNLSASKARTLLTLKDAHEQLEMFRSMMGQGITVRELEQQVATKDSRSKKGSKRRDPNILAQEQLLEERFGTKVRISKKGEKGSIIFEYHSLEELKRLLGEFY
ncbi:MAG: chromosome partitioning protein ParB [Candidatus Magasanikbacteria bacterium CG11_big_fil_rev_8_21_14_0_20_39_34]|uniref:Chromosome partitioning protein ParB n=1 Tax=Candidatus Magasanikbacteria bacterium CG11_big_fil_rev_8_21_14_0_20_39_34 TaxID=1974653 RepID=A0A2H0N407_9BACT|nr:MAG: chromosome partitioning protein ParB [Candidatus Magasanikbacteria bacterium CG11_big_fil_rev_8_21_14_0_20_39_34]